MRQPAPILLFLLASCLAGCAATGASRGGSSPLKLEDGIAALDARMIGLVAELDRLGRRVRAIENRFDRETTAPTEEPAGLPEEVAFSGILVDLRPLADFPSGRSFPIWRLVDPDGEAICESSQVPEAVRTSRPTFFTGPAGEDLSEDLVPMLGGRQFRVTAHTAEVIETEEHEEAVIEVGDGSAAAMRELPLDRILKAGSIVILVRQADE